MRTRLWRLFAWLSERACDLPGLARAPAIAPLCSAYVPA
jgi:hypothetical protein